MRYLTNFRTRTTPQALPIPGSHQMPNSAGGYAWAIDDWARLERFLILGSEGGTYYISEHTLTAENAEAVRRCILEDRMRTVETIVAISDSGRAPKNDPALFALAMAAGLGDLETRRVALAALPRVARTGTHLFHFAEFLKGFRGRGRAVRRAIDNWYESKSLDELALQVVKYQQRDGWTHADVLRIGHPKTADEARNRLYRYIVDGWDASYGVDGAPETAPRVIAGARRLAGEITADEAASLIREQRLPREVVPTEMLKSAEVWRALLADMPMTAMIRNLATMTRSGLLTPGSEATELVVSRLLDESRLRRARVHPIQLLAALTTYNQGRGARGKQEWEPVAQIVDALDAAFYLSFGNVEPSGKRLMLALDVSGSMSAGRVAGVPGLTPRLASAAMALVTAAVEPRHEIVAFSHQLVPVTISPRQRLDDVIERTDRIPFGRTDCALPMLRALERSQPVDTFVIYTDSETWWGKVHPAQALRQYRERMGIPARLIVVGMVSNGFSIADPDDGGMLDVVGFDTATPEVIRAFS
jgi:60 kDa SS-A/Ro ribonucleoprotein